MEGRPWVRVALLLIGFSLLGIPVWSMTREKRQSSVIETVVAEVSVRPLRVTILFAEPPLSFSLKHLDKVLCQGAGPEREFSFSWESVVPPEGVELLLKATWPSTAAKTAARVEISGGDEVLIDQTFWSERSLVQSVTVPGTKPK